MTQTTNTPAFTAKAAAAAYAAAKNAQDRKTLREAVAASAAASPRVRWQHLLKDIDAGDMARIKARATGDWSPINATREPKPAKAQAKPVPVKRANPETPKASVSAVYAAKALAALLGAGLGQYKEAKSLVAYIRAA